MRVAKNIALNQSKFRLSEATQKICEINGLKSYKIVLNAKSTSCKTEFLLKCVNSKCLGDQSVNITSHEEYGLRCAVQLARLFGQGPVAASKIAEMEGISVEYVSKFMHLFRKAGLVNAARGTQGGFSLGLAPKELSLKKVLSALQPKSELCEKFSGQKEVCVHLDQCSVRPLWSIITFYFDKVLTDLNLSDLLKDESNVKALVEASLLRTLPNQSSKHKKLNHQSTSKNIFSEAQS